MVGFMQVACLSLHHLLRHCHITILGDNPNAGINDGPCAQPAPKEQLGIWK
jgi:hypothetical protein